MLKKVLVANRGEIAVRVLRACEELGISTVAVYSDADRNSLHVRYADEAYNIGPAPARESYLCIDKIIEVAKRAKADAIHPGYGFLAENTEFGKACRDARITFIGPSPETIKAMGDKLIAHRTMQEANVPVVPGIYESIRDDDHALAVAQEIGFPIIIKAAAGGGGKGMRVVRDAAEMASSLRGARAEALAAFGDDTLYMEKLLEGVRHVEVQLLADRRGNTIHLGERECSIQRRHQKLIEESPSPVVDADMRRRMGEAAVKAAKAVGYESAGTVEFLVADDKNFYFLEMNTRIQVEHPVTEMVTGIDIVMEQLRIACGRKLRYKQADVNLKGWAIECRITSEDPHNDFLPSVGKIVSLFQPSGPGVRVDSGVFEGFEVTLYYDPLIAKLIVWGESRAQAILRMRRALSEFKILGIQTSIPFHLKMMERGHFLTGRFDTGYLERQPVLATDGSGNQSELAAIAAAIVAYKDRQNLFGRVINGKIAETSLWKYAARREVMRSR